MIQLPDARLVRLALLPMFGAAAVLATPLHAQTHALLASSALITTAQDDIPAPAETGLLIPVQGVDARQLHDTFRAARSGGRVHDAIDIHAPRGTPVIAVADGEIIRLHSGARGGLSLYHLDRDGRTRYYYAHLDHYAEGIRPGVQVRRGDVIGYVGDTGNAQPGDYHLHFSIAVLENRSRWWEGENLNPYPLLRRD